MPIVICRDHREMFTSCFNCQGRDFPEQPIVVLRRDGRVNFSLEGGSFRHGTAVGTEMDVLEL